MSLTLTPCQQPDTDPDDWFVDKGEDPQGFEKRRRAAKQACWDCHADPRTRAARLACLAMGLENKEQWGIWGGYDERERRAMLQV